MSTQEQQERHLEEVRTYLSCTSLRVDRCRHDSVTETSIWVFDQCGRNGSERQIAVIAQHAPTAADPHYPWRVSAMLNGSPVSQRNCQTMLDAVGEVMRATKGI